MYLPAELKPHQACSGVDPNTFFVEPNDYAGRAIAVSICNSCPVATDCLEHNLSEECGIIAGTTERERRRIRLARRKVAA